MDDPAFADVPDFIPAPVLLAEEADVQGARPQTRFPGRLRVTDIATVDNAFRLQRMFHCWLASAEGADGVAEDLSFAVGEVLANAAEHAYHGRTRPGPVHLHADVLDAGTVHVSVTDEGTWLPSTERPTGCGGGLALVRRRTRHLSIEEHPMTGTTVHLRACLQPA